MSDPIPKTIPRSTLACPPAKNFTDQYTKPSQGTQPPTASQQLSQKASTSNFEKVRNKEAEKDFKPLNKETTSSKAP